MHKSRLLTLCQLSSLTLFAVAACNSGAPAQSPPGASADPPHTDGFACTKMGCQSSFGVDLTPASWVAGRYEFAIDVDGAAGGCAIELPFTSCEMGPPQCASELFEIGESDCQEPASEHGLPWINFPGAPKQVRISISFEGEPLVDETITPEYTEVYPNGDECEPVCRQARKTLNLR